MAIAKADLEVIQTIVAMQQGKIPYARTVREKRIKYAAIEYGLLKEQPRDSLPEVNRTLWECQSRLRAMRENVVEEIPANVDEMANLRSRLVKRLQLSETLIGQAILQL